MTRKKKTAPPSPAPSPADAPPDAPPLSAADAAIVAEVAGALVREQEAAPSPSPSPSSAVDLERKIEALPLAVKTRVRISTVLAAGLEELGARAQRDGVQRDGHTWIDPSLFLEEVVSPALHALAADLQELEVLTLEEALERLAVAWTTPAV